HGREGVLARGHPVGGTAGRRALRRRRPFERRARGAVPAGDGAGRLPPDRPADPRPHAAVMIARLRERPIGLLTGHSFRALFDVGVFTQEGADAFVRVVIGLSAFLISLGLLLVYMYAKKYAAL